VKILPVMGALALWPLLSGFGVLERRNAEVEQGNAALKAGKPDEALSHYDKAAAALPVDAGVHFNRGAALYGLSRFEEAGEEFLRATQGADPALKASAFRHLGNAFAKKEKFKESIEAYKRALALRPDDQEAKWNLEIALRKQEEEKKKQEQQDKDKKDQQNKDDKNEQNKDKKEDQKKDQKDKQDKQDQKQDKQDQKQEPQKPDEKSADKQPQPQPDQQQPDQQQKEIEAVLGNLERSSKSLEQERARLRAVRRRPPAKDW